jgi:hypothetical protein
MFVSLLPRRAEVSGGSGIFCFPDFSLMCSKIFTLNKEYTSNQTLRGKSVIPTQVIAARVGAKEESRDWGYGGEGRKVGCGWQG